MKSYIVTDAPIAIGPGAVLQLDKGQAEARAHKLKAKGQAEGGKGTYVVTDVVQFKIGEVIGIEGEPPKGVRQDVMPAADLKAEEIAKVKARAPDAPKARRRTAKKPAAK